MAVELTHTEGQLALTDGTLTVCGDFTRLLSRIHPNKINRELVVRAAKIKGVPTPTAVDATAGLGEDSLLLAAAGFAITLFERNPQIAALLQDALDRAAANETLAPIAARMKLIEADSMIELPCLDFQPDVVLLDPMFPEKQKSAAVKKKLQLLQQLEQPCEDEAALLAAAEAAHPRKIVIKRPLHGPHLAGRKPSYSLSGKAVRYDVIAL